MSWIQKLYDTYEQCAGAPQFGTEPLMPISHVFAASPYRDSN